jgi:hypothetical protein
MRVGPVDLSVAAETMAARLTVQPQTPATDPASAAAAPAAMPPAVQNGAASAAALSGLPADQALAMFALEKGMDSQGQMALQLVTGRAQS